MHCYRAFTYALAKSFLLSSPHSYEDQTLSSSRLDVWHKVVEEDLIDCQSIAYGLIICVNFSEFSLLTER